MDLVARFKVCVQLFLTVGSASIQALNNSKIDAHDNFHPCVAYFSTRKKVSGAEPTLSRSYSNVCIASQAALVARSSRLLKLSQN